MNLADCLKRSHISQDDQKEINFEYLKQMKLVKDPKKAARSVVNKRIRMLEKEHSDILDLILKAGGSIVPNVKPTIKEKAKPPEAEKKPITSHGEQKFPWLMNREEYRKKIVALKHKYLDELGSHTLYTEHPFIRYSADAPLKFQQQAYKYDNPIDRERYLAIAHAYAEDKPIPKEILDEFPEITKIKLNKRRAKPIPYDETPTNKQGQPYGAIIAVANEPHKMERSLRSGDWGVKVEVSAGGLVGEKAEAIRVFDTEKEAQSWIVAEKKRLAEGTPETKPESTPQLKSLGYNDKQISHLTQEAKDKILNDKIPVDKVSILPDGGIKALGEKKTEGKPNKPKEEGLKTEKKRSTKIKPINVVKTIKSLIPKKTNLPILKKVRIGDGKMQTTDLDVFAEYDYKGKPNGLYKFVGNNLEKSALGEESYPAFPSPEKFKTLSGIVDRNELINNLEKALPFVSSDSSRVAMTGFYINIKDGAADIVSTDGQTLSLNKIKVSNSKDGSYIIKGSKSVIKALKGLSGENIKIKVMEGEGGTKYVSFEGDNGRVITGTIEGDYPNYKNVLPSFDRQIVIDKAKLQNAIKTLLPYAKEEDKRNPSIATKIGKDTITLIAGEEPSKTIKLPIVIKKVSYKGDTGNLIMPMRVEEPADFRINATYLNNTLKALEGKDVFVGFADKESPLHFYDRSPEGAGTTLKEPAKGYKPEHEVAFTSEKQANEAIASALKEIEKRTKGEPSPIADELKKKKRVDLTGRVLTKGHEARDIAQLFQVYRSPKTETFHVIYTDKNGKILAHTALTSGELTYVYFGDPAKFRYDVIRRGERLGADKISFLHNHPGGNVEMSRDDIVMAESLRKPLGKKLGEFVVIDHGKYSHYAYNLKIALPGRYKVNKDSAKWMESKGVQISSAADLAAFGKSLDYDKSKAVFVYTDNAGKVVGWTTHDKSILKKKNVGDILTQLAKGYGSNRAFIIAPNFEDANAVIWQAKHAVGKWLMDVIDEKGDSLRETLPAMFKVENEKPEKVARRLFEPTAEYTPSEEEKLKEARDVIKKNYEEDDETGIRPFLEARLPKEKANEVVDYLKQGKKSIQGMFTPELLSKEYGKPVDALARYEIAKQTATISQIHNAFHNENEWWAKVPEAARLDFLFSIDEHNPALMNKIAGGDPKVEQVLEGIAKRHRALYDGMYDREKALGIKINYVRDYITHLVKDPEKAERVFENMRASMGKDRFTKMRTGATLRELHDAGVELKTTIPSEILMERLISGHRAVTRQEFVNNLVQMGAAVRYVAGTQRKPGEKVVPWTFKDTGEKTEYILTAKRAEKYKNMSRAGQYKYMSNLIKGGFIKEYREATPSAGMKAINAPDGHEYFIPNDLYPLIENAGFIVNKGQSMWVKDTFSAKGYRGLMEAKNVYVPIKLSMSLFHPVHIFTIDTAARRAIIYDGMTKGDMGWDEGLKEIAKLSTGVHQISAIKEGGRLRKAWRGSTQNLSEYDRQSFQYVLEGGGTTEIPQEWRVFQEEAFKKAIEDHSPTGIIGHGMKRILEASMKPVFEEYIPDLKLMSYLEEVRKVIARRPELVDDDNVRRIELSKIWKSVDNRYGELTYKTLFWDPLVKDIAMGSSLSMGWNLGFIREYGGAIKDATKFAKDLIAKEGKPEVTRRMLFTLDYTIQSMLIGGLITWLVGGVKPTKLLDYFYPRSGAKNPDGSDARFNTPFYTREFIALAHHIQQEGIIGGPLAMALNKANPVLSELYHLWTNKDYYGTDIRDPHANLVKQIGQVGEYIVTSALPISFSSYLRSKRTMGTGKASAAFLGFPTAPHYITETPIQKEIFEAFSKQMPSGQTKEQERKYKIKRDLRDEIIKTHKLKAQHLYDAINKGAFGMGTRKQRISNAKRFLKTATRHSDIRAFAALHSDTQLYLLTKIKNGGNIKEYKKYFKYAHKGVKLQLLLKQKGNK